MTLAYGANALFTVDGLPAHPLLADAIAVLLPLSAVCSVAIAVHGGLRRRFGWPVFALVAVAVIAVQPAQTTGRQLLDRLPATNALARAHATLGGQLLPYALGFGATVVILLVAGRLADRERAAADQPGTSVAKTWQRIALLASVLVVGAAAVTTVQVVRIGTAGAQAVWQDMAS